MRTCQSCGKENPPDRDFCSCGEYLRWEPTGFVQAITPEMAAEAARQAAPAAPQAPEPAGEPAKGEVLHHAVEPGQRERVLALVRNQSGIVDNYDIRVEGLPQEWWSV